MNANSWDILDKYILGNTVSNYLMFLSILCAGLLFRTLISKFCTFIIFKIIKRFSGYATPREFYDLMKGPLSWLLLLIVGYVAFSYLEYPVNWQDAPDKRFSVETIVHIIYKVVVLASVTWVLLRFVDFLGLILIHRARRTESKVDDQLVPFFRDGLKFVVIVMSFFVMLGSIFEVNIVTLIGGLGIGGLAVALAAKETLENLLGSFTIFLDKPFIIGDQIKIGTVSGHVEAIGLRSTRIRTLEKSVITVPNKKMVDAELENITERTFWRVKFTIGLLYSTKSEDLSNIILQIKKALDNNEQISSDANVLFDQFSTSSLEVMIAYLVISNDYSSVMKVKETINFKIISIVRSNNTDFAFPSTNLYIEKIGGAK